MWHAAFSWAGIISKEWYCNLAVSCFNKILIYCGSKSPNISCRVRFCSLKCKHSQIIVYFVHVLPDLISDWVLNYIIKSEHIHTTIMFLLAVHTQRDIEVICWKVGLLEIWHATKCFNVSILEFRNFHICKSELSKENLFVKLLVVVYSATYVDFHQNFSIIRFSLRSKVLVV